MTSDFVITVLFLLIVIQLGVIYALVNRLMVQSGFQRMRPAKALSEPIMGGVEAKPPSVSKGKIIGGSQKVNL